MRVRRRFLPALAASVALVAVVGGACAPSNNVDIGLKDYATNVVYGDPNSSTTTLPAVVPAASLSPGFPGFIVSAPPPPPTQASFDFPPPPPPVAELTPDPCPIAPANARPIPAGVKIVGQPAAGTYAYKQQGTYKVGTGAAAVLPDLAARVVKNVTSTPEATWDVDIVEFGITTTTSYRVYRPSGRPEVDGLYIPRIVQTVPGKAPDDFSPVQPGLRIFPEPASAGAQWVSVANDPIHGVAMTLQGTLKELRKIDICGVFVETWVVSVSIGVRRPGNPSAQDDYTTTAEYLVAPALGGLIIADDVKQAGTSAGLALQRATSSQLIDLAPH